MSKRYMKKVYGSDILAGNEDESEGDLENSIAEHVALKAFNVFDVLEKNSEDEEDRERNGEEKVEEEEEEEEEEMKERRMEKSSQVKKHRKKKKKKRQEELKNQQVSHRKSNNELETAHNSHRSATNKSENDLDNKQTTNKPVDELEEDEVEKMLNELVLGEPVPSCSSQQMESTECTKEKSKEDVLMIEHKYLNPYNELKKIFGSKTVQAEQSNRKNRGRVGHIKRSWLVSSKEDWVPTRKFGLSMSLDNTMKTTGNIQYFVYEHSPSYRQIQLKFLAAVDSSNSEDILSLITAHPYHVDALLQEAEIYKQLENLPMAAECAERALYCLECGFHPKFDITSARCRLDYRKQQNRALFIALFEHLLFVGGRACYRTSLEFCKLLLSLDPEGDPLAVVLMIDFYALRAKEYEWFIEFLDFWNASRNLTLLPNIAYSLALAHFHLGHQELADLFLSSALMRFPGVLVPLLEKCGIQADNRILTDEYFNDKAVYTSSPALRTLQKLYVARSFHLWKEADVLPWLRKVSHAVLDGVDSGEENACNQSCELFRNQQFQGRLPRNILRHIILSDIEEVTADIHLTQNDGSVLWHDPLPPKDSIDIYKRSAAPTITTSSNILSLFFSSLFTDINADATVPPFEVVIGLGENNEEA